MEAALVVSTLERQRGSALPVEVAEPLPKLLIRKVYPDPLLHAVQPSEPLWIPRPGVGVHEGIERFDVNPPQLHRPFQLERRMPIHVQEVVKAAEFRVPSEFESTLQR